MLKRFIALRCYFVNKAAFSPEIYFTGAALPLNAAGCLLKPRLHMPLLLSARRPDRSRRRASALQRRQAARPRWEMGDTASPPRAEGPEIQSPEPMAQGTPCRAPGHPVLHRAAGVVGTSVNKHAGPHTRESLRTDECAAFVVYLLSARGQCPDHLMTMTIVQARRSSRVPDGMAGLDCVLPGVTVRAPWRGRESLSGVAPAGP